jgi:transcriptional regulator with XRE-family HTH domain
VQRSGRKHSAIAYEAGIAPETLSRVLNAAHARPAFETVVRITHATGHTVGWLLAERGYALDAEQVRQLWRVAAIIEAVTDPRNTSRG